MILKVINVKQPMDPLAVESVTSNSKKWSKIRINKNSCADLKYSVIGMKALAEIGGAALSYSVYEHSTFVKSV